MLELVLIGNRPEVAIEAEAAGVDWLMVDLERMGKAARQGHLDTVISTHSVEDLSTLAPWLRRTRLMARINPLHAGTRGEVEACLAAGARRLMLPMATHPDEVSAFVDLVAGRAVTSLLLETPAAWVRAEALFDLPGLDDVHIGLNDLHLGLGLDFMLELLGPGVIDDLARRLQARGMRFGVGGIARLGAGLVPAELVLERYRALGAWSTILSRDFWPLLDRRGALAAEVARLRRHVAGCPPGMAPGRLAEFQSAVAAVVNARRTARGVA